MFALHVLGRISHYNQEMLPSHPRSTDQLYRLPRSPRLLLSLMSAQRGSEVIEDDTPVLVFVAPSNPTQFRSQFQDVFQYDRNWASARASHGSLDPVVSVPGFNPCISCISTFL